MSEIFTSLDPGQPVRFYVDGGNASVTVTNGGQLHTLGGNIGTSTFATQSDLTVTGVGSVWQSTGAVSIGLEGTGPSTVTIEDGAQWAVADSLQVHENALVAVDVGSYWASGGFASVEELVVSAGTLEQRSGLFIVSDSPVSTFRGLSGLVVNGTSAPSQVTVDNGGLLRTTAAGLSNLADGVSTVRITGLGSRWENGGGLYVGGSALGSGGIAHLLVEDQATLITSTPGTALKVFAGGDVDVLDGAAVIVSSTT